VTGRFVLIVVVSLLVPERTAPAGEVIATSQRGAPASWRYTRTKPAADNWTSRDFDDSAWKIGPAPFGAAGTPGITPHTAWATSDIWLRRSVELPSSGFDPSRIQLLVFHDEDVEVYFEGVLAARAGGFVRDYQSTDIAAEARRLLRPGAKLLLAVHCHQTDGGQGIDVGIVQMSSEMIAARRRENYRAFAMSNPGNAAAGRRLFTDAARVGCIRCHTTDGSAGLAGPDLFAVGDKYPRADLINHVLNPSATVAVGYETTVVTTNSGDAVVGVVKEANDDHLGLMDGSGKLQRVAIADIKSRRTQANVSLMPTDLEAGLSPPEFGDLIEYVGSLRLPELANAGRQGMPARIAALDPPAALAPVHRPENNFDRPCWFGQVPAEPGTFLICEHQTGLVWRLKTGDPEEKTLWGDFRREIRPGGATGLLGLAFHPRFRENYKYYVQHQLVIGNRIVARVSEKIASTDQTRDSGQSSRTIIEFPCSTDVHSGGGIVFGPDGFLYIGMGDTGPQGDPDGHAQNLRSPLGKMLRIDVDHADGGNAYTIPADNPFRGRPDVRPEIWAYGLREPWRFSFDSLTHDLWVGDVGQDRIEEVDLIRRGENYGWNVYEGFDLFSTRYRAADFNAVPPVFAYNRRFGNSITGGYVYRGDARSPFYGVYICGDFTSRRVWGLTRTERKLSSIRQLCVSPQDVASFGCDEAGTIYLVGYQGTIYRLEFPAHFKEPS
jgi:putative heme-binding domain-containing protein